MFATSLPMPTAAQDPGTQCGFPLWVAEMQVLDPACAPPEWTLRGSWNCKQSQDSNPSTLVWDAGVPKQHPICCVKFHPSLCNHFTF